MTDDDDKKDPTVKQLVDRGDQPLEQVVDAATAAQLAKWFGLPSFAQVEAGEVEPADEAPPEDPEVAAVRERRRRIVEQLDPILLAGLERRRNPPDDLLKFQPNLEPIDTSISIIDLSAFEPREDGEEYGEPRTYQRPEYIDEILAENTPQALLRDLHRPEYDPTAPNPEEQFMNPEDEEVPEGPPDHRKIVDEVMGVDYWIEPIELPKMANLMADVHAELREIQWTELPKRLPMPNRRIEEGQ